MCLSCAATIENERRSRDERCWKWIKFVGAARRSLGGANKSMMSAKRKKKQKRSSKEVEDRGSAPTDFIGGKQETGDKNKIAK